MVTRSMVSEAYWIPKLEKKWIALTKHSQTTFSKKRREPHIKNNNCQIHLTKIMKQIGWLNGRVGEWVAGWMDGWMDGWNAEIVLGLKLPKKNTI